MIDMDDEAMTAATMLVGNSAVAAATQHFPEKVARVGEMSGADG